MRMCGLLCIWDFPPVRARLCHVNVGSVYCLWFFRFLCMICRRTLWESRRRRPSSLRISIPWSENEKRERTTNSSERVLKAASILLLELFIFSLSDYDNYWLPPPPHDFTFLQSGWLASLFLVVCFGLGAYVYKKQFIIILSRSVLNCISTILNKKCVIIYCILPLCTIARLRTKEREKESICHCCFVEVGFVLIIILRRAQSLLVSAWFCVLIVY